MILKNVFIFLLYLFLALPINSEPNLDQWKDTEKTYYDLIQEGFEVKAYDISNININNGNIFMFFVTVLQKNKEVYECQEYQTLDETMQTLDMSLVCRKLVQPFKRGLGT